MTNTPSDPFINCPKCGDSMRQLKVKDFLVDRCRTCHGIWLDGGERQRLMADKKAAAMIDVGPPEMGQAQDRETEIKCPRCQVPMVHRKHPDQSHIGFEECTQCQGSYFDAGELHDLSKLSLSDFFKIIFRPG